MIGFPLLARAQGDIDALGSDGLNYFFPKIQCNPDGVVFTRSTENANYQLQIADRPPVPSPPGSNFTVPYGTPFRVFAPEWEIGFLPIFKTRGVIDLWLIEQQNRRGDVHVALFGPSGEQGVRLLPVDIHSHASLKEFEGDCAFGAGMQPQK